jgi:hypothetical protein
MEGSSPSTGARRPPIPATTTDLEAFRRADRRVAELVAADPVYAPYLRMRTDSAVDGLAAMAAGICGFPEGSPEGDLVGDVVEHWALATGMLDDAASRRDDFLETFDLEYPRRRLGFLIQRLDAAGEATDGRTSPPLRADLGAAVRDLDDLRADIAAAMAELVTGDDGPGSAARARRAARTAFPAKDVRRLVHGESDRRAAAAIHLHAAREALGVALEAIGAHLREALPDPPGQGFDTLAHATLDWDEDVRRDLLVAYTGFPFWDGLMGRAEGLDANDGPDEEDVVHLERGQLVLLLLTEESGHPVSEAVLAMPEGEDREHITRSRPLP